MSVYYGAQAAVKVGGEISTPFDLGVGVLQGDTLAPYLFVIVLDWVMRNAIPDESLGLRLSDDIDTQTRKSPRNNDKLQRKVLTDLCYADDIALVSDNVDNANTMLASISHWARKVGLRINTGKGKTEYILVGDFPIDVVISVDSTVIAQVDDFKYLGSWIMDPAKDFSVRKGEAWRNIVKLDNIWKSKVFSRKKKFMFFQSLIEPILFYNAVTWTISTTLLHTIEVQYHKLLKYALDIRYAGENISHKDLFAGIGYVPPHARLRKLRLTFVGHCWRLRRYTSAYQSVSDLIFWKLAGSGSDRYPDNVLLDVNDRSEWKTLSNLQTAFGVDRKTDQAWQTYVNEECNKLAEKNIRLAVGVKMSKREASKDAEVRPKVHKKRVNESIYRALERAKAERTVDEMGDKF